MRLQNHFFLFLFFALAVLLDHSEALPSYQSLCKDIQNISAITRLKKYLFCDYDLNLRPTEDYKNATVVRFGLILQFLEVDDEINIIDLHAWTLLGWTDQHLTWLPWLYNDTKWIHVNTNEIWVPDITAHSASDIEDSVEIPFTECLLSYTGEVYCVPMTQYTTRCNEDHTWWPYDIMNCSIDFGSWAFTTDEIHFQLMKTEVEGLLTLEKYEKNAEWDIVKFYTSIRIEASKFGSDFNTKLISYHFLLKRHSDVTSMPRIVPAMVLMLLTLLTLWLEPKSVERMTIANLNFIIHLISIQDTQWHIPKNGSNTPNILVFYDYSLVMATLSLILTSILRHIQELNTEPPAWILSGTIAILRSKIGQILLVSILDPKVSARIEINADDNTDLVSFNETKASAWEYVTILIGWIAFLSVLMIYIVMLALYLPTSASAGIYKVDS